MKITDGGTVERLKGKVETIVINSIDNSHGRTFELWINGDSLSYVKLSEMLDLRDEINKELKKGLKITC